MKFFLLLGLGMVLLAGNSATAQLAQPKGYEECQHIITQTEGAKIQVCDNIWTPYSDSMKKHLTPEQIEMIVTDDDGHRSFPSCPRGWTFTVFRGTWTRDGSPMKMADCWRRTPKDWVEPEHDDGATPTPVR